MIQINMVFVLANRRLNLSELGPDKRKGNMIKMRRVQTDLRQGYLPSLYTSVACFDPGVDLTAR